MIKDDWITPCLIKCLQKHKRLYNATLSKTADILTNTKYKEYRNNLKKVLRKTRETYYQNKYTEYKRYTKKLWQMINRLQTKPQTNLP